MCGGSGGGGGGGEPGGQPVMMPKPKEADAGQPGEVVREANKANVLVMGGQVIKKGMTPSALDDAINGATNEAQGGTTEYRAGQEKLVSALRKAGVKASDYEEGTRWNARLSRWLA